MELIRLNSSNYDELIALLDMVFSRKNKREQHFEEDLPKMCVRDDLHMNRHLGIMEDGRLVAAVGIYPLPTVVDGTPLLFATVGNVVTHPDYEGRGYMNMLMSAAMDELKKIGADVSRLGGLRHRYNRFGYESAGVSYTFTFNQSNLKNKFPNFETDLELSEIKKEDMEALKYVLDIYNKNAIAVDRLEMPEYQDVYKSLAAWRSKPYLVTRKGEPVGYFSVDLSGNFSEWGAQSVDIVAEILALWRIRLGKDFNISVAPYQTEVLSKLDSVCERYSCAAPSHFKIINWDKVTAAFLHLRSECASLPDGEFTLGIDGYGRIKLEVKNNKTSCTKTEETADLTLDPLAATRLLFGQLPPISTLSASIQAWLPLPLTWNLQDRV